MESKENSSLRHIGHRKFVSESPRSLRLFEQAIKSPITYKTYKTNLCMFFGWAKKDHDSILEMSSSELQEVLEEYLFHLKKRLSPNSIGPHLAAIDKFLAVNDVEYKKRKLRMFLPEKVKCSGIKAWTTQHIQRMLEYADTRRTKALIHFLSASGVRVGALEDLRWKNIEEMPNGCYCVTIYEKSNHEYITFLHHEARQTLDDYTNGRSKSGETINGESFVFPSRNRIKDKSKPLTRKGIESSILRVLKRAGIERTRENRFRFDIAIDTGFRKRFNTILKSNPGISYAIAERMMDHKTYMETHYLDTTNKDKFFEEYKKAIPDLIIDDSERLRAQNQKLEAEKAELEKKSQEVEVLKRRQEEIMMELEKIKKRQERSEKYGKRTIGDPLNYKNFDNSDICPNLTTRK
ncbi:MAG: tyrosine-type recombinase/integrase [Nitrosopumilaceae archaeon]